MKGEYRVHFAPENLGNPFSQTVRMFVSERTLDGASFLGADGVWKVVPEGAFVDASAGIALPAEAMEALAEGVDRFFGGSSHPASETKVLREWLAVEQRRVDEALNRG